MLDSFIIQSVNLFFHNEYTNAVGFDGMEA